MGRSLSRPLGFFFSVMMMIVPLTVAPTYAKDTITWRVTDWSPMYILQGSEKGRGVYDELIFLFIQNMPEYDHRMVKMNTQRALSLMQSGFKVCHTSVLKRSAEGKAHISLLNSLLLEFQVIFSAKNRSLLDQENTISLEALIQDQRYKGGIASFGTHKFLEKFENSNFEHIVYRPEMYDRLVDMLLSDRVDYIVQYSPVVAFAEKDQGKEGATTSLFIKETVNNPYVRVYTACDKSKWGLEVIEKINRILLSERKKAYLAEIQLRWYDKKVDSCCVRPTKKNMIWRASLDIPSEGLAYRCFAG